MGLFAKIKALFQRKKRRGRNAAARHAAAAPVLIDGPDEPGEEAAASKMPGDSPIVYGASNSTLGVAGGARKAPPAGAIVPVFLTDPDGDVGDKSLSEVEGVNVLTPPRRAIRSDEEGTPFFASLPALTPQSPVADFQQKLRACCVILDLAEEGVSDETKALKRAALAECVEYMGAFGGTPLCDSVVKSCVLMVSANIFRGLPPKRATLEAVLEPEDGDPFVDPQWGHLQFVYELFLRLVGSPELPTALAIKYLDHAFVVRFVGLFDSSDARERDMLKSALHRMYGKFMSLRSFVRRTVMHSLFSVVYEVDLTFGVAELLEILGSIVNGFSLPLRAEHKEFLEQALLPLHRARVLPLFHEHLCYCLGQFADKEAALTVRVISSILRVWPVTVTNKQVLLLREVDELLQLTPLGEFGAIAGPVFDRLASCSVSMTFQLSDRMAGLWKTSYMLALLSTYRQVAFPIIVNRLACTTQVQPFKAGSPDLRELLEELLVDVDVTLYNQCLEESKAHVAEQDEIRGKWEALAGCAPQDADAGRSQTPAPLDTRFVHALRVAPACSMHSAAKLGMRRRTQSDRRMGGAVPLGSGRSDAGSGGEDWSGDFAGYDEHLEEVDVVWVPPTSLGTRSVSVVPQGRLD